MLMQKNALKLLARLHVFASSYGRSLFSHPSKPNKSGTLATRQCNGVLAYR